MARRQFDVPTYYRSEIIRSIKQQRMKEDPRRRDFSPTEIDLVTLKILVARHFGFCYGVENAIEIAYRALEEHPDRPIYLLSEMIHNPNVNEDLRSRGVRFLMSTSGEELHPWEDLDDADIVIVPAFGTTLEIEERLKAKNIDPYRYDTTCPFVRKVWNRSEAIGKEGYTVVVHGKPEHEETRATFSHSRESAPTIVVRDLSEADLIARFLGEEVSSAELMSRLGSQTSEGFEPETDLERIGVVNQTTMLATETAEIAAHLREAMLKRVGPSRIDDHFADTRDTLCYATNENQSATLALRETGADLALVIGGYNSSNTSHLVEILEEEMPTYYVRDASEIESLESIRHFDLERKQVITSQGWYPSGEAPVRLALTSGASCPDASVDEVIRRLHELTGSPADLEVVAQQPTVS